MSTSIAAIGTRLCVLLLSTLLVACGGDGGADTPPVDSAYPAGIATFGVEGGTVAGAEGAALTIPAGALGDRATFALSTDAGDAPPLPPQARAIGSMWSATPHGTLFATDAGVRIPFDASALQPGEEPVLLKGDPEGGWTVVQGARVDAGFIVATVRSLSFFQPAGAPAGGFSQPADPPATEATFALELLNDNFTPLVPTGANVRIRQQQDPAEPARLQVRYTIPTTAAVLAGCAAPQALGIRLLYTPVQFYSLPGQPGNNRILLDPRNAVLQPLDQQIEGPELGRPTELEIPVNVVDHPFNPVFGAVSIQPRPALPPGAERDATGVQIELQLECRGGGSIVTLPTAVLPIVVARGFPESPVDFVEHPWPLTGLVGRQVKSDFRVQFDTQVWIASVDQGDVVWESAPAGSTSFAPLPAAGTLIDANGNLAAATRGYYGTPGFVVGRGTLADNGRLVRLTYCVRKRADGTDRRCTSSRAVPITVVTQLEAPRFTLQPRSRTHQPGESLDMMAAYEGLPTPQRVTWQLRTQPSVPWEDATARGFYVHNENSAPPEQRGRTRLLSSRPLVQGQAFQFRATYTTNAGTAVSDIANVTVATGQAAPTIVLEPLDVQVAAGGAFSLISGAAGGFPLSYQWSRDGRTLPGANGQVLTLTGASPALAGLYRLEVRNSAGRVQSRQAQVSLVPTAPTGPQPPLILRPPQATSAAAGTTVSFSVGLAGNGLTPAYQWLRDGSAIAGATGATLTLSAITAADQADYAVRVSNSAPAGTVTSAAARLTVTEATAGPLAPTITAAPTGLTLSAGQTARFSVAATGSAPLAYQWQRDGFDVPGANAAVLDLPNVGTAEVGAYRVVVTNVAGSATSALAGLALAPSGFSVFGPTAARVQLGENARFTATVVASPAPTCQWLRDGNAIPGATSCTGYTTGASGAGDNGAVFALNASSGGRTLTSSGAVLTVVSDIAPTLVQGPTDQTTVINGSATFAALATGSPTPLYRWSLNGSRIAETLAPGGSAAPFTIGTCTGSVRLGAGGASITLSSLAARCAGASITVLASNAAGTSVPAAAVLVLSDVPAPTITTAPASQTVVAGFDVTFTAAGASAIGGALGYQWALDGVPLTLDNITTAASLTTGCSVARGYVRTGGTLTLRGPVPGCSGATITVRAIDGAGSSAPASATLTVTPRGPVVTLSPATASVVAGNVATDSVTFASRAISEFGSVLGFSWRLNDVALPASTGNFNVNGCTGSLVYQGSVQSSPVRDASLLVSNLVEACDGAVLSVTAFDIFGTSIAARSTIFVAPRLAAPAITEAPQAQTITEGGGTSFTGTASGNPSPTMDWWLAPAGLPESALSTGPFSVGTGPACTGFATILRSADRSTLVLSQVARGCNGAAVRLRASNTQGNAASTPAALTVNAVPAVAPTITAQPNNCVTTSGGGCSFGVLAAGPPAPSVQWRIGGSALAASGNYTSGSCSFSYSTRALAPVQDSTGTLLELSAITPGCSSTQFSALVSNSAGSVSSNTATLIVQPASTAPVITAESGSINVDEGQTARFSVTATGTNLTYQWFRNAQGSVDGMQPIAGATSAAYTTPPTRPADNETYYLALVCSGPQPGGLVVTPECTLSGIAQLSLSRNGSTIGACFGGATGWCFVQPSPHGTTLLALAHDPVRNRLFVAGTGGMLMNSDDLGSNWAVKWEADRQNWTDLARLSAGRLVGVHNGPLVGSPTPGGVFVSDNDGATWTRKLTAEAVRSVAFADDSVGVAVGQRVYRTEDGGGIWSEVIIPPSVYSVGSPLNRIAYAGNSTFVAVGEAGVVIRSTDGGQTWEGVAAGTGSDNFSHVTFSGTGFGLLVRASGDVLRSADFGASWASVVIAGFTDARTAAFADGTTAVVLNQLGHSVRSTDAGVTWSAVDASVDSGQQLWRLSFVSPTLGYAVGQFGALLRTGDAGLNWRRIAGGRLDDSAETLEASPDRSVTLGIANGAIRRSTDGGRAWTYVRDSRGALSWGSNTVAMNVDLFSGNTVFSTDAGLNWAGSKWTADAVYNGGAMASATTAITLGREPVTAPRDTGGFVEHTTNRGASWTRVTLPGSDSGWLWAARFISPTVGFIGGSGARLYRTPDGGASWGAVTLPLRNPTDNVQAIAAGPGGTVFVAADSDLMRSEDNGLSWTSVIDSSTFGSMKGVAFEPGTTAGTFTNVGIAVGVGGIWRSTDGGLTWTLLDLPLDFTVLSAAWPAAGVALAGGDGGALLRNAAGGQIAAQQPGPAVRVRALATRPAVRGAVRPSTSSAPPAATVRRTSAPRPPSAVAPARTPLDPRREYLRSPERPAVREPLKPRGPGQQRLP